MKTNVAVIAVVLVVSSPSHATPVLNAAEGHVNFYKHTGGDDDGYTANPSTATIQFMNAHWPRLMTYAGYWDLGNKLSWYPNAWAYQDSCAIYTDPAKADWQQLIAQHPDWILKDASGNRLYIRYQCNDPSTGLPPHTCTQYAANLTDPNGFRAWWIGQASTLFSRPTPYKGLFMDDVNLDISRISDGDGNVVTPIDPITGQPMLAQDWRKYFAEYLEQVRAALPNIEIIHNWLWDLDDCSDPYVQREIRAADWVNDERGFNDQGLTGTGQYSLDRYLSVVDNVHANGRAVIFDTESDATEPDSAREYSVAAYLLVSSGSDLVGDSVQSPTTWWPGFDSDLGPALSARYGWNNLLRRDFSGGIALVNPPDAAPITVALPGTFQRVDGSSVTSITLNAAEGAVLSSGSAACRTLSFVGGTVSPGVVLPGGAYSVTCDYGAQVQGIGPVVASGACQWFGFVGTGAQYNCNAGAAVGTFAVSCQTTSGTADNLCPHVDAITSLQVVSALNDAGTGGSGAGGGGAAGGGAGGGGAAGGGAAGGGTGGAVAVDAGLPSDGGTTTPDGGISNPTIGECGCSSGSASLALVGLFVLARRRLSA
jgi:hypothetical protein